MRPNECTKNGRKGAHGLNCKIFVNFEAIFESTTKITLGKNISCLSDDFEFLPLNHLRHFRIFDLLEFVWAIQFSVDVIDRDSKSLKKVFESALTCAVFLGQNFSIF